MKVYAVYSIPKSPEYRLEKLFHTKEAAKQYIKDKKSKVEICACCSLVLSRGFMPPIPCSFCSNTIWKKNAIYDIQIEEVIE